MHAKWVTPRTLSGRQHCAGHDPRREILDYLHAHPAAADTVAGIVDWWLPRQRWETATAAIQRALDDLVTRGVVDEVVSDVGTTLYRLHRPRGPHA